MGNIFKLEMTLFTFQLVVNEKKWRLLDERKFFALLLNWILEVGLIHGKI